MIEYNHITKCNHIIKASGYITTSTAFNISTNFTTNCLCNGNRYKLILCSNLPAMTTILPTTITIGSTVYPILDIIGNNLMNDQLRTRKVYEIILGTNPKHFILDECVRSSCGN